MKINKKGIIHLLPLILIGVVVVGVGAAYYFDKNSNTPLLTKSSPESEEISEEEMSDWATYKGDGFSFKYPSDFETKYVVFVELDENEYTKRLGDNILNYQETIVGQNKFYVGYIELGGRYRQEALLKKDNQFYEFRVDTPLSDLTEYTEESLNQLELTQSKILSTFEFIQLKSTYINKKYGYQFEYPSEYDEGDVPCSSSTFEDDNVSLFGCDSLVIHIEPIDTAETDPQAWWNKQESEDYLNKSANCFESSMLTTLKSWYEPEKTVLTFEKPVLSLDLTDKVGGSICIEPQNDNVIILEHKGTLLKIVYDTAILSEEILSSLEFTK